ncbi:MAG: pilus assembly protein [Yersinia sp. (in: enterobacteria)]
MMKLMMKGYVAAQLKTEEFLKDNRGSIIEYVMVIALAGVLITIAKPGLEELIKDLTAAAKVSMK